MSPRVVSLRTGQTPSQAQKRSGKDGKCTRNCPVERKRVPQKVNCSSGFEGGATRGTRSREIRGRQGLLPERENTGGRREASARTYTLRVYMPASIFQ